MKISGLIVAAGLSSRMKDFKPLMEVEGKPLILNTINSLKQSGIEDINLVVGYRGDEIERCLEGENINIIYNDKYNSSFMYDSFKLGLKEIKERCDAVVFLPGDVGFISKFTLDLLISEINKKENKIVYPTYKNLIGHPPIISSRCFDYLLSYDGQEGLKGGMGYFKEESKNISTPDKFILFDMDTKEDFCSVKENLERRNELLYDDCMFLLDYFEVTSNIVKHSQKVREICIDLGKSINKYKNNLNISLIESASLLHDIKRNEKNHAQVGADLLKNLGYEKIYNIVRSHTKLERGMEDNLDEITIVYFGDKLVIEDKFVDLNKRFEEKLNTYKYDLQIKENIMKKYNTALKIKSNIISIIGREEYEKLEQRWRG